MDETVDVQMTAIGVGTVPALAFYAYGRYIGDTVLGFDPTTLAIGTFAVTFAAIALLHNAYGRRDFAAAHATAALGLGIVAVTGGGVLFLAGYLLLVVGGLYIAVMTMRARREEREVAERPT
ncbi:hypothetical protein [Natronolimnohabitans innermongolicus]|uniref:Uncharacterized protein n=1 Tax=Natronolimnohabitans innermongolicus JCM 12255 TaxID=1227499 RepID=L9XB79_9EURY|nr:hypothetical protein [Natronolimnohabitans innermongolicus]ELY58970.1 hypothetical protein C493_05975 [Natronolimnohabitans innermongolicus JCM 12255]